MEKVSENKMEHFVKKADELAQLNAETQRAFRLAAEIIRGANEAKEEKEKEHEETN